MTNFVVDKFTTVRWSYKTSKHYKRLGYFFTKWGDDLRIKTLDLPVSSKEKVKGVCPVCGVESIKRYELWTRRGTTFCPEHSIRNLIGFKTGNLEVISLNGKLSDGYHWNCACECGRETKVSGKNLTKANGTKSCGKCNFEDIAGQKFNRLTAIKHVGGGEWLCECNCGNEIYMRTYALRSSGFSCGKRKCTTSHIFRSGKNSPTWNSELTDADRSDRRINPRYKQWAKDVKARDNYICQACKIKSDGKLVSHHLNSYANFPELRYNLDNGVTLCKSCHRSFHLWMGGNRVVCTNNDYERWISD